MRCREEEEEDEADEEEVSPSGRQPEMEETKWVTAEAQIQFDPRRGLLLVNRCRCTLLGGCREVTLKAGIEGMLTRLQRDRERARPPPRPEGRSDNGGMWLILRIPLEHKLLPIVQW